MCKIIKIVCLAVIIFPTVYFAQIITQKQFTPNNSGYPSRYNKSITFLGDSLLVPSDKFTIYQISKGNWSKIWFDSPGGSFIEVDKNNNHVWLMSDSFPNEVKLIEYNWNTSKTYSYPRIKGGEHLHSFAIDKSGNKWIGSDDEGIYRFSENGWMKFDTTNSKIFSNNSPTLFINDVKNELWVISYKWNPSRTVFSIFDGQSWKNVDWKDIGLVNMEYTYVPNLVFDKYGNPWLIASQRLIHFNGSSWQEIKNATDESYGSIGIDINDNKWFTYYNASKAYVVKYDDVTWNKYQTSIWGDGRIWIDKFDQKWFIDDYGIWVFKENGLISDVDKKAEILPEEFSLAQNYPNPFNPSTTIEYEIPMQSNVKIVVFDILGRKIETLLNKEQPAGNYKLYFDGSRLNSGIYFYTITTSSFVQTKKMVLMK